MLEFLDAFREGDFAKILGLLTEDATWWAAGTVPGVSGRRSKAEVAEAIGGMGELSVSGGLPTTVCVTVAQGDRVVVEARTNAEFRNGKVYRNEYLFLFRLRERKILEVREYMDTEYARTVFVG